MAKVLIVGAGAAGLMAAGAAVRQGHQVTVLEHTDKPGQKILVTGKGRCNVTNVADIEDFFKQIPRNPRFLNAAARQFTHEDVTGLLDMLGTPTKVERGGRVFPESDKASDVTRALDRGMRDAGVVISLNTEVAHVKPAEYGFDIALTQGGVLRAATVNLQRFAATGENRIVLPAKQAAASASAGERSMMAAYREENGVYAPSRFYLKDGKTD